MDVKKNNFVHNSLDLDSSLIKYADIICQEKKEVNLKLYECPIFNLKGEEIGSVHVV